MQESDKAAASWTSRQRIRVSLESIYKLNVGTANAELHTKDRKAASPAAGTRTALKGLSDVSVGL